MMMSRVLAAVGTGAGNDSFCADQPSVQWVAEMKNDGSWIMWAGTPYAHLMINQRP